MCFVGDVGLARIMDASHLSTGIAPGGTWNYAAPELLMATRCNEKVRWHDTQPAPWLGTNRICLWPEQLLSGHIPVMGDCHG